MARNRLLSVVLAAAFLAGLLLSASDVRTQTRPGSVGQADWRDDLRYFAKELPKRHKNLYHATSRDAFERAVNELDAAIPTTNVILVGEPIGERPNSYSENDEMTLPHSRLVVSYSTKYYNPAGVSLLNTLRLPAYDRAGRVFETTESLMPIVPAGGFVFEF
jgi:hypothetical protein